MAEPFLGELRLFPINFAPQAWQECNGQLMPINQNQALFALLGTTYGGNGQTNFALPDLRGRVPIHVGNGLTLGQSGGEVAHTLTNAELPTHTHTLNGSTNNADVVVPVGNVPAVTSGSYGDPQTLTPLDPTSNGSTGGSQAHLNMQPYLTLTWCIATQGIFPSPN